MAIQCYNCNTPLNLEPQKAISRNEECFNCQSQLRVCKMCLHYSPSHYNECKEPNAERVTEKEKANFCDYFSLDEPNTQKSPSKEELLKQAQNLFKK